MYLLLNYYFPCFAELNECAGEPCRNQGVCIDGDNSFTCDCVPPYYGPLCDQGSKYIYIYISQFCAFAKIESRNEEEFLYFTKLGSDELCST